jgi:hypothetical protein
MFLLRKGEFKMNKLKLEQGVIELDSTWSDCLLDLLEKVDRDFTGCNGEEFYTEEGISEFEVSVNRANKKYTDVINKIEMVLEDCKKSSASYYSDFEAKAYAVGDDVDRLDAILLTIATYSK